MEILMLQRFLQKGKTAFIYGLMEEGFDTIGNKEQNFGFLKLTKNEVFSGGFIQEILTTLDPLRIISMYPLVPPSSFFKQAASRDIRVSDFYFRIDGVLCKDLETLKIFLNRKFIIPLFVEKFYMPRILEKFDLKYKNWFSQNGNHLYPIISNSFLEDDFGTNVNINMSLASVLPKGSIKFIVLDETIREYNKLAKRPREMPPLVQRILEKEKEQLLYSLKDDFVIFWVGRLKKEGNQNFNQKIPVFMKEAGFRGMVVTKETSGQDDGIYAFYKESVSLKDQEVLRKDVLLRLEELEFNKGDKVLLNEMEGFMKFFQVTLFVYPKDNLFYFPDGTIFSYISHNFLPEDIINLFRTVPILQPAPDNPLPLNPKSKQLDGTISDKVVSFRGDYYFSSSFIIDKFSFEKTVPRYNGIIFTSEDLGNKKIDQCYIPQRFLPMVFTMILDKNQAVRTLKDVVINLAVTKITQTSLNTVQDNKESLMRLLSDVADQWFELNNMERSFMTELMSRKFMSLERAAHQFYLNRESLEHLNRKLSLLKIDDYNVTYWVSLTNEK